MDERILNLHQKIKTQPVVLPEQSVLLRRSFILLKRKTNILNQM